MSRRWIVIGGLVVLLGAVGWWVRGPGTSSRSGPEPPLPELADVEPRVSRFLSDVRQRVLDRPRAADAWGRSHGRLLCVI